MSIALILAVGQDLLLLDTRSWILRAASYVVESALSPTQSINQSINSRLGISIWFSFATPSPCRKETDSLAPFGLRVLVFLLSWLRRSLRNVPAAVPTLSSRTIPKHLCRALKEHFATRSAANKGSMQVAAIL